jgi:Leucine-rich repeat (LRR) protein
MEELNDIKEVERGVSTLLSTLSKPSRTHTTTFPPTSRGVEEMEMETLDLSHDESLTDISFIRQFPNLVELNLENTRLGNNYKPITYLSHLQSLKLSRLGLTAISPLSRLTNLVELDLSHGGMRRISPLLKLVHLERLNLFSCVNIKDIYLLGNMKLLTHLNIAITTYDQPVYPSLDFLSSLLNLKSLNVSFNPIESLDPLGNLINLEILDITACGRHGVTLTYAFIDQIKSLKQIRISYQQEIYFQPFHDSSFQIICGGDPNPSM